MYRDGQYLYLALYLEDSKTVTVIRYFQEELYLVIRYFQEELYLVIRYFQEELYLVIRYLPCRTQLLYLVMR